MTERDGSLHWPGQPRIDAITFDLDGTLIRYSRSPGELLSEAFDAVGIEPLFSEAAYRDRFDEFVRESGSIRELREDCFAALAREAGEDPELGRAVAAEFAATRDHTRVELLPGAAPILDHLSRKGVPVGVITNGPRETQARKLEAVGLSDRAAVIVYAGDETPPKPAPDPFRRALDVLGVAPGRTVHVGDSPADVAGAQAAGLRTIRLDTSAGEPSDADRRVGSLRALADEWTDIDGRDG